MKVDIQYDMKDRLGRLLEYVKERVADYKANRTLIADFVERFMVVELKRLSGTPDIRTGKVEISDEAIKEADGKSAIKVPMQYDMKDRMGKLLEFIKERIKDYKADKKIIADFVEKFMVIEIKRLAEKPDIRTAKIEIPEEVIRKIKGLKAVPKEATKAAPKASSSAPRSGNGHQKLWKRPLSDDEKNIIRKKFKKLNGMIREDSCLPIKEELAEDVSIAQVTGFVTYLHNCVRDGSLELPDMKAYEKELQTHHEAWAKYDSPKYKAMRSRLLRK